MFSLNFLLLQIFPYVAISILILGTILRLDGNPYSWRTKSSQLLRRKLLIRGSVLFHVGILTLFVGHIVGLMTPVEIWHFFRISHGFKQIMAMTVGGLAGVVCLVGLLMLLYRRLSDVRIRRNSSVADIAILLLLLAQLLTGLWTLTESAQHLEGHEMVKFMYWAQDLATFKQDAYLHIKDSALVFKVHITLGFLLFTVFPFTRLVHALTAPIMFVFRPYQIIRKKG